MQTLLNPWIMVLDLITITEPLKGYIYHTQPKTIKVPNMESQKAPLHQTLNYLNYDGMVIYFPIHFISWVTQTFI